MKYMVLRVDGNVEYADGTFEDMESIVSACEKTGFGNMGYSTILDNLDSSIELLYADGILRDDIDLKINSSTARFSTDKYIMDCCIAKFDFDSNMIDMSEEDIEFIKGLLNIKL